MQFVLNKLVGSLLWVESSHICIVRKNNGLLERVQKQVKSLTVASTQKLVVNEKLLTLHISGPATKYAMNFIIGHYKNMWQKKATLPLRY